MSASPQRSLPPFRPLAVADWPVRVQWLDPSSGRHSKPGSTSVGLTLRQGQHPGREPHAVTQSLLCFFQQEAKNKQTKTNNGVGWLQLNVRQKFSHADAEQGARGVHLTSEKLSLECNVNKPLLGQFSLSDLEGSVSDDPLGPSGQYHLSQLEG